MKGKLSFNSFLVNRLLLALMAILVIGALFGTHEIVGLLQKKANKLVSLKAQSQALSQEQSYLVSAKKEIQKYSSLQQIAESIVPQDKDQAETVRQIVNIAQTNGITLTGISFPSSTLGTVTSSTALSLSQLTAVKGIPGVYTLPITVVDSSDTDAVSYPSFYSFLTGLEQNRRTSLVTGISIQPISGGLITFSLTINEYIKPQ